MFLLPFAIYLPRNFYTLRILTILVSKPRQDVDLEQLVKEVMENDMVLQAIVGEAEMLIFPSVLLPEQHQSMHFLFSGNIQAKEYDCCT